MRHLQTTTKYGLTINKTEKINYYRAMSEHPEFIHLHNPHKFDARFLEKTKECDTYEEAYHAVEAEHKKAFGYTKYSNYHSYRNARRQRIKRKMQETN